MQLIISAGLIAGIVPWGVLDREGLAAVFDNALSAITRNFGWFYLWAVLALVVAAIVLAAGRHGRLRLGGDDKEPEFSFGAWFAILFAAGMGIGLVFWGVAEPTFHYNEPPPGIAAGTPEAANAAMRYSFFHWGSDPWAIYSVVALAIAFFQFHHGGAALVGTSVRTLPWGPLRHLAPVAKLREDLLLRRHGWGGRRRNCAGGAQSRQPPLPGGPVVEMDGLLRSMVSQVALHHPFIEVAQLAPMACHPSQKTADHIAKCRGWRARPRRGAPHTAR